MPKVVILQKCCNKHSNQTPDNAVSKADNQKQNGGQTLVRDLSGNEKGYIRNASEN